jgi:hypothetical protein
MIQNERCHVKTLRVTLAGLLLVGLMTLPGLAWPQDAAQMEAELEALLRPFRTMGTKGFETSWPDGKPKEKYSVAADGTVSYAKFYPAGNFAVKYQRKPDGAITYERWHGNGRSAAILTRDPRIMAYTSYWPDGTPREKFQSNFQTKDRFYIRHDEQGRQVVPQP